MFDITKPPSSRPVHHRIPKCDAAWRATFREGEEQALTYTRPDLQGDETPAAVRPSVLQAAGSVACAGGHGPLAKNLQTSSRFNLEAADAVDVQYVPVCMQRSCWCCACVLGAWFSRQTVEALSHSTFFLFRQLEHSVSSISKHSSAIRWQRQVGNITSLSCTLPSRSWRVPWRPSATTRIERRQEAALRCAPSAGCPFASTCSLALGAEQCISYHRRQRRKRQRRPCPPLCTEIRPVQTLEKRTAESTGTLTTARTAPWSQPSWLWQGERTPQGRLTESPSHAEAAFSWKAAIR